MTRILTLGYSGWKPADIRATVESHNAVLWDIRYSPKSRHPQWQRQAFASLLDSAYVLVPALGNRNYKGGAIELAAPAQALDLARRTLAQRPIILMCGCRNHWECHRLDAAEYLGTALDIEIKHLYPGVAQ
jgi:uncharacterized protein (DUF488 family)